MTVNNNYHIPVLLKEVVDGLRVKPNSQYIDATLGGGGHCIEIIRHGGNVLGIDCDPEAIKYTQENFKFPFRQETCSMQAISNFKLILVQGNFAHLKEIAQSQGFTKVAGILFDLGVSSHQLEKAERGFSFKADAPLDMRMDPGLKVSAADLINGLREGELYELFIKYSEEYDSRAIARAIVRARTLKPIKTCNDLADIIIRERGVRRRAGRIHPATRVFQALRIAVNDELNNLKEALPQAVDLLESGGRLVILSFHSLEDRIVKNFFKDQAELGLLKILTSKPIGPEEQEIEINPRSRSAKLRMAEKF